MNPTADRANLPQVELSETELAHVSGGWVGMRSSSPSGREDPAVRQWMRTLPPSHG